MKKQSDLAACPRCGFPVSEAVKAYGCPNCGLKFGGSPRIYFMSGHTLLGMPRRMKLDDLLDGRFKIRVLNVREPGAPFVGVREKGSLIWTILYEEEEPLNTYQYLELRWKEPPTLKKFLEEFKIKPKKRVVIEFLSGWWKEKKYNYNDSFFWNLDIEL